MPDIATSQASQGQAQFIVSVNGTEIPQTISKLSINVMKVVNKISTATLVLQDGNPSTAEFELMDGDLFVPGNEIAITAGVVNEPVQIFTGIIIKQSLKIRMGKAPQLVVECRHKSIKTTIGRKNACFHDMTDSEVFNKILKSYNFTDEQIDVSPSSVMHEELVQYNCTDWDFILNRAEMTGKVIFTNDDTISIQAPKITGDAKSIHQYGVSLIEFDAEIDSRNQYTTVKAKSWDMATQEIAETEANEPADFEEQGNFTPGDLAAVVNLEEFTLNHAGSLTSKERQTWADAQLLKSRLSKIRGRAKFRGEADLNPGDIIELNGLGNRLNGKAFISGVRQDYDGLNGWKTQVQFGHSPEWFAEDNNITAPKAGGLLPGVVGLHTGIVTDNEDPQGEMRVRVKFPFISAEDDGVWARMALADAGNERGLFFRPEIGDEVVTGFLYDDPRHPVILGMLHSSALPSPLQPSNDNHLKGFTSREKLTMLFDDEKKDIKIATPAGNSILLSDNTKTISMEDQNGNKIQMNEKGISLNDDKNNELLTLDVQNGKINIVGKTKVTVEAPQIELVQNATHPVVFGDALLTYLNQIVQIFNTHMHPGELAMGSFPVTPAPPVPPLPPATPSLLSVKVKTG